MIWLSAPRQGCSWPLGPQEALSAAQASAQPACLSHPAWNPGSGNRTAAPGLAGHSQPGRDSVPRAPLRAICSFGMDATGAEEQTSVPAPLSHFPCSSGPRDREKTSRGAITETVTTMTVHQASTPSTGLAVQCTVGTHNPHRNPAGECSTILTYEPVLREVQTLTHSHTANKWQNWDSDLDTHTHQTTGSEGPRSQVI